jgi:hypothetical protein
MPSVGLYSHSFSQSAVTQGVYPEGGRQRPLGIATLEDKIVQRAVVEVLNAVYETDFLGVTSLVNVRPSDCVAGVGR